MMHTILQQKILLCLTFVLLWAPCLLLEFVNRKILNPQFYVSDANE